MAAAVVTAARVVPRVLGASVVLGVSLAGPVVRRAATPMVVSVVTVVTRVRPAVVPPGWQESTAVRSAVTAPMAVTVVPVARAVTVVAAVSVARAAAPVRWVLPVMAVMALPVAPVVMVRWGAMVLMPQR